MPRCCSSHCCHAVSCAEILIRIHIYISAPPFPLGALRCIGTQIYPFPDLDPARFAPLPPRGAALHRSHHARQVPQVHRERSGAGAEVPAGVNKCGLFGASVGNSRGDEE